MVGWNSLPVVKEVVSHVIADVSEDTATVHQQCCVPVVEEDSMGQLPEGCCQDHKQCRRHDKAVPVHREVVMNAVEQEVKAEADAVVRKPPGTSVSHLLC